MSFITLLTDYAYKDFYLAKIQCRIKRLYPKGDLLNLSHEISNHHLGQTAYVFNAMLEEFAPGDLHFIFVNLHYAKQTKILAAKTQNHGTIIAPDNGLLGLLNTPIESYHLLELPTNSFRELDVLDKAQTLDLAALKPYLNPFLLHPLELDICAQFLRGQVIYIDSYGNCITNIDRASFEQFTEGVSFFIKLKRHRIEALSMDYSDDREGGAALFFNQQGFLEIASVHGNASNLFGLQDGTIISVKKN